MKAREFKASPRLDSELVGKNLSLHDMKTEFEVSRYQFI